MELPFACITEAFVKELELLDPLEKAIPSRSLPPVG